MRAILATLLCALPALAQSRTTLPPVRVPPENPQSVDKINLGKALFWDEQLSATGTVACATCHIPEAGGADPRTAGARHPGVDAAFGTADDIHGSPGVPFMRADATYEWDEWFELGPQVTGRKAPSVLMAAYDRELFWDGRAPEQLYDPYSLRLLIPRGASLERQATVPVLSSVEMTQLGTDWPEVEDRVRMSKPLTLARHVPAALRRWFGDDGYPALFARVWGTPDVTPPRIAMAIASYQRTLVPDQTPIDRYLLGDHRALTALELRGFELFERVGCVNCHEPPTFAGGFFNIGVRPPAEDPGRSAISRDPAEFGAFKTPSLRNVADRAPYFHNGSAATLAEVVEFYDRGGDFAENRSDLIQPLRLTPGEKAALLAFLGRPLTDGRASRGEPPFDHPELFVDGHRVPRSVGSGTPGTAGRTPRLIALEPPLLGNRSFKMAVRDGLVDAPAALLIDLRRGHGERFLGVRLWVGLSPALQVLDLGQLFHGTGTGDGWASWALALPTDPALAGTEVFLQALALDAGARAGLSASAGVQLRLFAAR